MSDPHSQVRFDSAPALDGPALADLYASVGWTAYSQDPQRLLAAVEGSDFVVAARADDRLVGLVRCVSDDVSIVYIQDILVSPEHRRRGMGRSLVEAVLRRYAHVRQTVLLTDDRPEQLRFYASLGFQNTRELERTPLNAFVRFEGVELA